jgi:hypothetical protein
LRVERRLASHRRIVCLRQLKSEKRRRQTKQSLLFEGQLHFEKRAREEAADGSAHAHPHMMQASGVDRKSSRPARSRADIAH